jgi:hypothetical protein
MSLSTGTSDRDAVALSDADVDVGACDELLHGPLRDVSVKRDVVADCEVLREALQLHLLGPSAREVVQTVDAALAKSRHGPHDVVRVVERLERPGGDESHHLRRRGSNASHCDCEASEALDVHAILEDLDPGVRPERTDPLPDVLCGRRDEIRTIENTPEHPAQHEPSSRYEYVAAVARHHERVQARRCREEPVARRVMRVHDIRSQRSNQPARAS